MNDFQLATPTEAHLDEVTAYRQEFLCQPMDGCGTLRTTEPRDWIAQPEPLSHWETTPEHLVPATHLGAFRLSDGRLVGLV